MNRSNNPRPSFPNRFRRKFIDPPAKVCLIVSDAPAQPRSRPGGAAGLPTARAIRGPNTSRITEQLGRRRRRLRQLRVVDRGLPQADEHDRCVGPIGGVLQQRDRDAEAEPTAAPRQVRQARGATSAYEAVLAQRREEDHVADRLLAGEHHRQPVDPEPEPARRRHPVRRAPRRSPGRRLGLVRPLALGLLRRSARPAPRRR